MEYTIVMNSKSQHITETMIQAALVDYCRYRKVDPYLLHIPNQQPLFGILHALRKNLSKSIKIRLNRQIWGYWTTLKKIGFQQGVSDLFLSLPRGDFHGLWLEVKNFPNKPTIVQKEFLERMRKVGYAAHVIDDIEKGIKIIKSYLSLSN